MSILRLLLTAAFSIDTRRQQKPPVAVSLWLTRSCILVGLLLVVRARHFFVQASLWFRLWLRAHIGLASPQCAHFFLPCTTYLYISQLILAALLPLQFFSVSNK